jgi:hypothetical protein
MTNMTVAKDQVFAVSAKLQNCIELFDLTIGTAQSLEGSSDQATKLVAAITGIKDYLTNIDADLERLC